MDTATELLNNAVRLVPTIISLIGAVALILIVRYFLQKGSATQSDRRFRVQLITLILSFVGLVVVILTLPVSDTTVGQLLSLLGIVLSAAIALSATTFVGNIMAGLMLRAVRNFRPGDFVRVGDHFGRVSERGLFHVEIQTEDRDLTTLPNQYLVTNPVKVIRSSGTLVTAQVSLGYDVPRDRVRDALLRAATATGLEEPFVHIVDLGDFAITYRIAGLLTEVKGLLSARSRLREMMLDHLHEADIEIVSPTFMNQRQLAEDTRFMAKPVSDDIGPKTDPETVVFDKADEAESLQKLRERRTGLQKELEELEETQRKAADEAKRMSAKERVEQARARLERLEELIVRREEEAKQSRKSD